MKKIFTYHFDWSLLTIAFFSLIVSFFVFINIIHANTGGSGGLTNTWMEMNGWAWSPNIGWVSLNCNNDTDGDGELNNTCETVPYGLKLETSDEPSREKRAISGCAWAGNVGWWICFDDPGGHPLAPTYGVYLNGPSGSQYYLDGFIPPANSHSVENSLYHEGSATMHASILPLESVSGWSNELGFPIAGSGSDSLDGCFNCSDTIKRCSIIRDICSDDAYCQGIYSESTCEPTCANCLQYTYNEDDPPVMQSVVAGYDCSDCTFNGPQQEDTICTENAYGRNDNTCTSCEHYYSTPGLIADYTTSTNDGYGSMCGWAWNQDQGSDNGVGWIQFSPRITAGNNPYFQVNSGNIYAKGKIKNKNILGPNIYNAFVIETYSNASDAIYNLYASSTLNLINRPLINLPTSLGSTGKYTNILGSIDYTGLITEVGETDKNKYGSTIYTNTGLTPWTSLINGSEGFVFDNSVFSATNVSDIANNEKLTISVAANKKGTGIVRIQGEVTIHNNIEYIGDNNVNKLSDLPSVVWIIEGNLTIDPSVTKLAGTFIVFGGFNTGDSTSQLIVNGSVLARNFVLNRKYSENNEPAELFINDGRLKVNPPAGLQNFSANLPKFSYQ